MGEYSRGDYSRAITPGVNTIGGGEYSRGKCIQDLNHRAESKGAGGGSPLTTITEPKNRGAGGGSI